LVPQKAARHQKGESRPRVGPFTARPINALISAVRVAAGGVSASFELKPDIVLMDIAMPELNGLEATARIARAEQPCPVLVLSMHATEQYVLEALRSGASGYVLKEAGVDELMRAIHSLLRGERYLTPAVSKLVLDDYMRLLRGESGGEQAAASVLTARQREILQLVAEGKSTREIAAKLHLSVKTVETHRTQLMQRLGIFDVAGLTRFALRNGIITPD